MKTRMSVGFSVCLLGVSMCGDVQAGVLSRLQNNRASRSPGAVATVAYASPDGQYVPVSYVPPSPAAVATEMVSQIPSVSNDPALGQFRSDQLQLNETTLQ
jgi:hypothetical protein